MSVSDLVARALEGDLNHREDQCALTEEWVMPAMPEVVRLATAAREKTDFRHQQRMEKNARRPVQVAEGDRDLAQYPIGFCKIICEDVFADLSQQPLIQDLVSRGVVFKNVYIILYGRYFQNAIQIGNLYLDAANDTVDPEKPFLEWMPITDLDYQNLESWEQVISVVESYFHARVIPNRYFPLLAPFVPFISVRSEGQLELLMFQDLFFLKDLGDGMRRYIEWISSKQGAAARTLPKDDQALLEREFGANLFEQFPFEYAPATTEQLIDQAKDLYAASREENGEAVITKLVELARQASVVFKSRQLKSRGSR